MKFRFFFLLFLITQSAFGQGTPGTVRFPNFLDTPDSLFRVTNNGRTTLGGAMSQFDTQALVVNASVLPNSGAVQIDNEIIIYTGKSGNFLTGVIRAQDGTSAAAHSTNAPVRAAILAIQHTTLANSLIATQTKLGFGSSVPASGTVLFGNGAGSSVWSSNIGINRLSLFGNTTVSPPPSLGDSNATRLLFYDASVGFAGEYMGVGVDSGTLWFNNLLSGNYKFYFGANSFANLNVGGFKSSGFLQTVDTGTKPACNATNRFMVFGDTGSTGNTDTFEVCRKDAADSYAWQTLMGSGGGGGPGTVTSVGLSAPNIFTVSGSPVTGSGTLGFSLNSQTSGKVLIAPNGSTGTPTFRRLEAGDLGTGTANSSTCLKGDLSWATCDSGGVDFSGLSANKIPVFDGTNLVSSTLSQDGSALKITGAANEYNVRLLSLVNQGYNSLGGLQIGSDGLEIRSFDSSGAHNGKVKFGDYYGIANKAILDTNPFATTGDSFSLLTSGAAVFRFSHDGIFTFGGTATNLPTADDSQRGTVRFYKKNGGDELQVGYKKNDGSFGFKNLLDNTGGAATLDDLSDVTLGGTPTAGQILKHNGTVWTLGSDTSGGGVFGTIVTNFASDLTSCSTGDGGTLIVDSNISITTDILVPAKCRIVVVQNGKFTFSNNAVLTFNTSQIEAPPNRQIFFGNLYKSDNVTSSVAIKLPPENQYFDWWGSKVDDGLDDRLAFQAAIDSQQFLIYGTGEFYGTSQLKFGSGQYNISDTVVVKSKLKIVGAGRYLTKIYVAPCHGGIRTETGLTVSNTVSYNFSAEGHEFHEFSLKTDRCATAAGQMSISGLTATRNGGPSWTPENGFFKGATFYLTGTYDGGVTTVRTTFVIDTVAGDGNSLTIYPLRGSLHHVDADDGNRYSNSEFISEGSPYWITPILNGAKLNYCDTVYTVQSTREITSGGYTRAIDVNTDLPDVGCRVNRDGTYDVGNLSDTAVWFYDFNISSRDFYLDKYHGIHEKIVGIIDNVAVEGFDGFGIFFNGGVQPPCVQCPTHPNPNLFAVSNTDLRFNSHGFLAGGTNANQINIGGYGRVNVTNNRVNGGFVYSLQGGTIHSAHFSDNEGGNFEQRAAGAWAMVNTYSEGGVPCDWVDPNSGNNWMQGTLNVCRPTQSSDSRPRSHYYGGIFHEQGYNVTPAALRYNANFDIPNKIFIGATIGNKTAQYGIINSMFVSVDNAGGEGTYQWYWRDGTFALGYNNVRDGSTDVIRLTTKLANGSDNPKGNGVLEFPKGYLTDVYTSLPSCSSATPNRIIFYRPSGTDTAQKICAQKADNSWAWGTIPITF